MKELRLLLPDSWLLQSFGRITAVDLDDMPVVLGVTFLKQDVRSSTLTTSLKDLVGGRGIDVILSDMAPKTCGDRSIDHFRSVGRPPS